MSLSLLYAQGGGSQQFGKASSLTSEISIGAQSVGHSNYNIIRLFAYLLPF